MAATVVMAGCGGKSSPSGTSSKSPTPTTTTTHKRPAKAPAY
ncbi:MAG TPA: hypothetical protein VMD79_10215 [Solirubrobacteraceae bacterium]|nr:hypothetical protein [Solirubrobacteraceae bacterium]